ncbi:MAG TPA: NAD-dependent epimerase/dehydratase family protein, partial [Candidatus Omnitrophica bacterium]|nr:NAD-dependent epimerase/dehydratase family protein [Candidatus Omnitrophota bacterium]
MIILTGAAGFIGSCILWDLNRQGISDIIAVDYMDDSGKSKNIQDKKFKDYLDRDEFLSALEEGRLSKTVDCIIHMGACSSTTLQDEGYFRKYNYEYSQSLCKWSISNKARFLYASSAATYGDGSFGYSDEDETTRKLKPLNLYGKSKQMFDLWILDNMLADKVAGFKFFNVFGPNEYHKGEMRSVVAKKFNDVKRQGKISLFKSDNPEYNDGEQKRDF